MKAQGSKQNISHRHTQTHTDIHGQIGLKQEKFKANESSKFKAADKTELYFQPSDFSKTASRHA
jgi:hypothetical protein